MRGKEKREAYGGGGGGYNSRRDYQDDSYRWNIAFNFYEQS